jgi:transcriptional/translational regulatory protein YebC/TACO1
MFSRVGRITLTPREGADLQHVWDAAIDAGAEDVNSNPEESTREMEVSLKRPCVTGHLILDT